MHIDRQIKFITGVFLAMVVLLAILATTVMLAVSNLKTQNDLVSHTSQVQSEIKDLESITQSAIAIRQVASFDPEANYRTERDKALKKVAFIRQLVADNKSQIENINSVELSLNVRFQTQDDFFAAARINEVGILSVDERNRQASINSQLELANAFYKIKTLENSLMFERLSALSGMQWALIYIIVVTLVLKLSINIAAFWMTRRTLSRTNRSAKRLEAGILNSTAGGEKVFMDAEELFSYVDFLRETKGEIKYSDTQKS